VPSWMVGVSASVSLPLHHKVQKFSSGTSSAGWSQKKGREMVVGDGGGTSIIYCIEPKDKEDQVRTKIDMLRRNGPIIFICNQALRPTQHPPLSGIRNEYYLRGSDSAVLVGRLTESSETL